MVSQWSYILTHNLKCHILFQHLQYLFKYHLLLSIQCNSLCPYNKILAPDHILDSHNHTKTHRSILQYNNLVMILNNSLFFLYVFCIFHAFTKKTPLFTNLKDSFSKSFFAFFLRSLFISIYGFRQWFWLNLITL